MPQGQTAPDLDLSVRDWIERFNKAKGWQSYSVPKPEALKIRDPNATLSASPRSYYAMGIDEIGSREDAVKAVDEAARTLSDLQLKLGGETDPQKIRDLEQKLREAEDDLAEKRAELKLLDRFRKRMDQVKAVEDSLPQDLIDQGKTIEKLRDALERSDFDLDTLDKDALARFRDFHDMVSKNVEKARQEVMPLTREGDSGTVTQMFAVINAKEYKLLFGMLEEALLLLQLGRLKEAEAKVLETSDALVEYRNARTGADPIAQRDRLDPSLDEPLMQAEAFIEMLAKGGFTLCAQARQTELDGLTGRIRIEKGKNTPDIGTMFKGEAGALASALRQDVEAMHKVEGLLAEAVRSRQALLANGHVKRPKLIQDRLNAFVPGPKAADNVLAALAIRDNAAERLKNATEDDLKDAKIDKGKLDKLHQELRERYETLAGQVKKLPPEVKSEIDLQILAAGQLLQSASVDALKQAKGYLTDISIFIGNIEKYPKTYELFRERLANLGKAIKKLGSDYPLYEVAMRSDLQIELDVIGRSCMTRNQKEVLDDIIALTKKVADVRTKCGELRGLKRVAVKMADALSDSLDRIGKTLEKKPFSDGFVKFDGYCGSYRGELAAARGKVEKRTEAMIEEGTDDLGALKLKVDALVKNLAAYRDDRGKMKPADLQSVTGFLSDARDAQVAHDLNESKKKEFETERDKVKETLKAARKTYERLKSDPSDLDVLISEVEMREKEMSSSHAYLDGVKRMKALLPRVQKLVSAADAASEILDGTLAEAARAAVGRVTVFTAHVKGFYDSVLKPAGKTDKGNQFDDGTYDGAKVRGFLNATVAAIPQKALDDLPAAAAKVAEGTRPIGERRDARKAALAHVRALMAVFDGFKPVQHLRVNPFDSTAATHLTAVRQALPRLEMRLLTAIKE